MTILLWFTLTLCIQEVLDWNVMRAISINRCVAEDVFARTSQGLLGILVTQGVHVVTDVGSSL